MGTAFTLVFSDGDNVLLQSFDIYFFSDEFAVNSQATLCSVTCGWGKRIYAKVNCNNKNKQNEAKCDQSLETSEIPCKVKDCPPNNYGPWSSWTPCSITCKSNVNQRSVSIILSTDMETDVSWNIFVIWKINSGLWAGLDCKKKCFVNYEQLLRVVFSNYCGQKKFETL